MARQHDPIPVQDGPFTFPVTVRSVIGEVEVDPYGDGPTPHQAAFYLIASHDTPGTYEFPMRDGRMCCVEVSYVEPG